VKYRCEDFLLTPEQWYEERGFVPNVCFPCATIHATIFRVLIIGRSTYPDAYDEFSTV
jgi:predicted GH43/DUF377 family glycosyl hydrolase